MQPGVPGKEARFQGVMTKWASGTYRWWGGTNNGHIYVGCSLVCQVRMPGAKDSKQWVSLGVSPSNPAVKEGRREGRGKG
jgi:hypothetical protein